MNQPFRFKQFTVEQDRCAMKIGTDGVLLGAWTQVGPEVNSILDVGAGTGIIALMMAQRSDAELIDALEIDDDAYEQAVENFENSPWGDRLFCYHASFKEFTEEMEEEEYDLIVSNPPFYPSGENESPTTRETARFQKSLPFEELLWGVSQLLSQDGSFCTIVPKSEEEKLISRAAEYGLFPNIITEVKGTAETPVKRSLIRFGFNETVLQRNLLVLEEGRHQYTAEYKEMVKDFYLKL